MRAREIGRACRQLASKKSKEKRNDMTCTCSSVTLIPVLSFPDLQLVSRPPPSRRVRSPDNSKISYLRTAELDATHTRTHRETHSH